jgi:hypothetical protein
MSNQLIADAEIDRALDFLRDNAEPAARAKAERVYCEEYRKSLKAILMQEHNSESIGAQEREAYAAPLYREHLEKLKQAVFEDERNRALRVAAEIKIEAWRTMNANYRSMKL